MAAAATRNLPTVHLDLKDLLGDAPIHSLLKAIEAAATSEVGATSLDALLVTLEVLGAEAARIGLVNRTWPDHEQLLAGVLELAQEIASKSPLAIRGTKEMIRFSRDHSVEDGLNYIATWNAAMLQSDDLKNAVMAHMSKQKPEFAD